MGPGPLDILLAGLAAVGFVAVMGVIAFAAEPHYAEARARFARWGRSLPSRLRREAEPNYLPPTWCPKRVDRLRTALRGRRRGLNEA